MCVRPAFWELLTCSSSQISPVLPYTWLTPTSSASLSVAPRPRMHWSPMHRDLYCTPQPGRPICLPVAPQMVAQSRNSETFIALCLLTVAGTSLITQRLGLSDTMGAFLAGVLLSETSYRTQVGGLGAGRAARRDGVAVRLRTWGLHLICSPKVDGRGQRYLTNMPT
jgi:hypothetical protein